jgi:hypothetical protein
MFAVCLTALAAQAQSRTWVSGTGNDGNPCSRTQPCLTFNIAFGKTAAGGEIDCLDAGAYGPVTITKSITISCEAGTAGMLASFTFGVTVNVASTDVVYLRGLDMFGNVTGIAGINFIGAGVLHVEHCVIHDFNGGTAAGINFAPTGPSRLFVSDSYLADNGVSNAGAGILIRPTGTAGVNAVLNHVHVENNPQVGIKVDSTAGTGTVNLMVIDSIAAGNANSDIAAFTTPGNGTANVMINRSSLSASNIGLRSDGPTTTVRIGSSAIFGNVTGVVSANGGVLLSYGNNQFNGNTTDGSMATIVLH